MRHPVSVFTERSVIFQPLYEETICVWVVVVSAASPTLVVKTENCLYIYTYIYVCIYGTCVFHVYMYVHPASFVRDAIFPHSTLVHITTVAQETRLARLNMQWEPT